MTDDVNKQCDWLDDYLAADLSTDSILEFEKHLGDCAACQAEVDQWDRMSQLLQKATSEFEQPSVLLEQETSAEYACRTELGRTDLNSRRIVGRTVAAVVAVAAACLLLALSFVENEQGKPSNELAKSETIEVQKPEETQAVPRVEFPDEFIGVPIDIEDENVTIVWVYPTATSETIQEHFNAE